jgi:hypothetical protein
MLVFSLLCAAQMHGQIVLRPGKIDTYSKPQDPFGGRIDSKVSEHVLDIADADGLRNVQVTPNRNGVVFRFFARQGAAPTVEIDKRTPTTSSTAGPTFPGGAGVKFGAVAIQTRTTEPGKEYIGGTHQVNAVLDTGAIYHYIIRVPNGRAGRDYYYAGSFKTTKRKVKIVFTRIHLISGGLDGSDIIGTLHRYFYFYANPREPSGKGSYWRDADIKPGEKRRVEQTVQPLFIDNAPDRLRVMAAAGDSIMSRTCSPMSMEPLDGNYTPVPAFHSKAYNANCKVMNFATAEFDLGRYQFGSHTIPFSMIANADLPSRVTLAFDVAGYVEVTNE